MLKKAKKVGLAIKLLIIILVAHDCLAANELKVMSFNTWRVEDTASGREAIVYIVKQSGADIVGFQELGYAEEIASKLGWYHHSEPKAGTHVMSKYQIISASVNGYGAKLALPGGVNAWFFNTHLPAYPYQPYDLRDSKVAKNEAAVISAANSARGSEITNILNDISASVEAGGTDLLFLTGDFNEPSCLDWTQAMADASSRTYDLKVNWPASRSVLDSGLKDSFRTVRPDEVNDHGYSWTPKPAANEVLDRIDIIYFAGNKLTVSNVKNIGEDITNPDTDISYANYPSDHRAVLATFEYAAAGLDAGKNILTAMDILARQGTIKLEASMNYQGTEVTINGWQAFERNVQGELSETQKVVFADNTKLDSEVNVTAAGNYILQFSVVVNGIVESDEIELVVFEDSGKAAKALSSWKANYFDLNKDCVVNVFDLAAFSGQWLDSTALSDHTYYTNSYFNKYTVLAGASGVSTNDSILADHGSAQPNTPHIALSWSPVGGSNNSNNQWESYSSWPGGGDGGMVYQMGSMPVNEYQAFTIVFTPEAGYRVNIACLDMNVWSGGGETDVDWVVNGSESGQLGFGLFSTPNGQVKNHVIDVTGTKSEVLTLTLTQRTGDGTYLAMDNLTFSEIAPLD